MAQKKRQQSSDQERSSSEKPQPVEWVLGGLSALLVVTMIGFVFFQAVAGGATVPSLTANITETTTSSDGYLSLFVAHNRGNATAADVEIEGRIIANGQVVETSHVILDYLPAHSQRQGGLLFDRDPRQYRIEISARSYRKP